MIDGVEKVSNMLMHIDKKMIFQNLKCITKKCRSRE